MKRAAALASVALLAFLHAPLLVLAAFSFNEGRFAVWEGFSWRWYAEAARDQRLVEAAGNSLWIAAAATLISTAAGTLCAWALWKRQSRLLTLGFSLSLVTPEIVTGVSLLAFFQWLFRFGGLQLGMHTVVLAHAGFCLAFVVFVVLARLRTMDASLEEAAMDLGATEWQAFRRVTLPNLAPGVVSAALLAFAISFDDYVITSLVAGVDTETLPMALYAMARRGGSPVVNAISTAIVALLGAAILAAEGLRRKE
ncbi:MAG: ABC transporter permease [Bryobacteraceae bacterium]|nr:ABC transporter permease [Bryobacteraceae bacterium]MCX7604722.1 ABC transporter permease [Bryobacteraceae bacterium]